METSDRNGEAAQSGQNKWDLCRLFRTSAGAGSCNRYASANQTPLLIEATSNQVDQFSGYTGMTPADFRGFVCQLADSLNFPQDALILGGDHLRPKSLVDSETLIVVYISSHPYTRQYDLGLLTELRRDRRAMRVIAIAVETDAIIEAGPHILLPPSRSFIDMEQAFCFLMYAQVFALAQSIHVGNTPDLPSASGTINRGARCDYSSIAGLRGSPYEHYLNEISSAGCAGQRLRRTDV